MASSVESSYSSGEAARRLLSSKVAFSVSTFAGAQATAVQAQASSKSGATQVRIASNASRSDTEPTALMSWRFLSES